MPNAPVETSFRNCVGFIRLQCFRGKKEGKEFPKKGKSFPLRGR